MDQPFASATALFQAVFPDEMRLKLVWHRATGETYTTTLCWSRTPVTNLDATHILHPTEYQRYQTIPAEIRRSSYLRGRYCAKQALHYFLPRKAAEICIINGVFQQPLLLTNNENIGVSISHSTTAAVAIAFPEQYPMAVDIEEWNPDLVPTLEQQWTPDEQRLLEQAGNPYQQLLFWSAKEALSKVLKTGLMVEPAILAIGEQKQIDTHQVFHFKHFSQYKALVFSSGTYVIALVVPAKSELII